nr:hypothetical protein [Lactiplantibacillus plantarum]
MNIIVLGFQKRSHIQYRLFKGDLDCLFSEFQKIRGNKELTYFLDHAYSRTGSQNVFDIDNDKHYLQTIDVDFALLGKYITENLKHPILDKKIDYVFLQVGTTWYNLPANKAAEEFSYLVSDSYGLSVSAYTFLKKTERKLKSLF